MLDHTPFAMLCGMRFGFSANRGSSTSWILTIHLLLYCSAGLPLTVMHFFQSLKSDNAAFAILSGRRFGSSTNRYMFFPPVDIWRYGLFHTVFKSFIQLYLASYIKDFGHPSILYGDEAFAYPLVRLTPGYPTSLFPSLPLTYTKLYQDSAHLWSHCVRMVWAVNKPIDYMVKVIGWGYPGLTLAPYVPGCIGPTYGAMPCMSIGPIWVALEAIGQLSICIVMVL